MFFAFDPGDSGAAELTYRDPRAERARRERNLAMVIFPHAPMTPLLGAPKMVYLRADTLKLA